MSEENLARRLRKTLERGRLSETAQHLLNRIESEFSTSPTKVLKEDLVAVNDIGDLQGQIVCARREALPDEAQAYARRNRIEVILKGELVDGFRRLLHPDAPATSERLAAPAERHRRR